MEGTHRKKLSLERIVWKEMMKVMVYANKLIDKKADLLCTSSVGQKNI